MSLCSRKRDPAGSPFLCGKMVMMYADYIGIFDSGVGGVSVLKEIAKVLPNESIFYFGDAKNAPYGDRPQEEIAQLSLANADYLFSKGVKALVIACNTATSSGADLIREKYPDKIVMANPGTIILGKKQMLRGGISEPRNKNIDIRTDNEDNLGEKPYLIYDIKGERQEEEMKKVEEDFKENNKNYIKRNIEIYNKIKKNIKEQEEND